MGGGGEKDQCILKHLIRQDFKCYYNTVPPDHFDIPSGKMRIGSLDLSSTWSLSLSSKYSGCNSVNINNMEITAWSNYWTKEWNECIGDWNVTFWPPGVCLWLLSVQTKCVGMPSPWISEWPPSSHHEFAQPINSNTSICIRNGIAKDHQLLWHELF